MPRRRPAEPAPAPPPVTAGSIRLRTFLQTLQQIADRLRAEQAAAAAAGDVPAQLTKKA